MIQPIFWPVRASLPVTKDAGDTPSMISSPSLSLSAFLSLPVCPSPGGGRLRTALLQWLSTLLSSILWIALCGTLPKQLTGRRGSGRGAGQRARASAVTWDSTITPSLRPSIRHHTTITPHPHLWISLAGEKKMHPVLSFTLQSLVVSVHVFFFFLCFLSGVSQRDPDKVPSWVCYIPVLLWGKKTLKLHMQSLWCKAAALKLYPPCF